MGEELGPQDVEVWINERRPEHTSFAVTRSIDGVIRGAWLTEEERVSLLDRGASDAVKVRS